MALILGMDTGGTYTDGVVIDASGKSVLCKAKALTTKEDLTVGIKNCIKSMDIQDFSSIGLVSLSTTLATNAIVEGRGCRVALLLLGGKLDEEVPADYCELIRGSVDIMGRKKDPLDEVQVRETLERLRGKVEALAVSQYAGVRNPRHEQRIQELAEEVLGIPTVCGHQLTSSLGFYQRTVTAVLNARLIPIINELLYATRKVLLEFGITAPIMVMKGDGNLMQEDLARVKPIETILSGPAASITGGAFLTGQKDGLVLDMGGTTTDIAHIEDGRVNVKKEGAKVGGWLTRVQAAEISTYGLGGDSHVYLDQKGNLKIGPRKVIPLCLAGKEYPNLAYEMRSFTRHGEYKSYSDKEADCYILAKDPQSETLSKRDEAVLKVLENGPHSLSFIAGELSEAPEVLDLTHLVESGILHRISVTPTDILHVQGRYVQWDETIARVGVSIMAKRMEISVPEFVREAVSLMTKKLSLAVLQSIADFEGQSAEIAESESVMYFLDKVLTGRKEELLKVELSVQKTLIAIGAPVGAWVEPAAKKLNVKLVIPEHAEVANAVGAAVGQIMETFEVNISVDGISFIVSTPMGRDVYESYEEALHYGRHNTRRYAADIMKKAGCEQYEFAESSEDIVEELLDEETGEVQRTFRGKKIQITIIGKPEWKTDFR